MSRPRTVDRTIVRTKQVNLRLTKAQYDRWKAKADRLGIPISRWLRSLGDRDARM